MDGNISVLAPQQVAAIDAVTHWHRHESHHKPVFKLFGYAGTGKTAIAKYIASGLDGHVLCAAFTGKAALTMQQNGCGEASTIHKLIYKPYVNNSGAPRFVLNRESHIAKAALVIVDEASMVDATLARDLLSFRVPILALGDPAQLPPIRSEGFFMRGAPDVMLTEIHRQAADSPVIRLATMVRKRQSLQLGNFGSSRVILQGSLEEEDFHNADQILVGKNVTRNRINTSIRTVAGRPNCMPVVGDRLVCTENETRLGIMNGEIFEVIANPMFDKASGVIRMTLKGIGSDEKTVEAKVPKACFLAKGYRGKANDLQMFDFGYALTVHNAQGSQWPNVLLLDESTTFEEFRSQWLYTAITRASEKITIVM